LFLAPIAGSKTPVLPQTELGLTKHFCPVTLKDNVLRRASKVHCVRYEVGYRKATSTSIDSIYIAHSVETII
jgi:hypothetical protein